MMKDVKIEPIAERMNTKPTTIETFPDSGCQETLVSADLMDYLHSVGVGQAKEDNNQRNRWQDICAMPGLYEIPSKV